MVTPSPASPSLERSVSQQSAASVRSYRSSTVRGPRSRKPSHACSSASSIAASDKSLTSFPSFSPDSPRAARSGPVESWRAPSCGEGAAMAPARGLVDDLVGSASPHRSGGALFEDAPISSRNIPGALHHADDAHIERLITKHGALGLVRQIAADLAQRDAQITTIRRKAEDRERALRKIILECGLSNMELETRLRTVEAEMRVNGTTRSGAGGGAISDLMNDAMQENDVYGGSNTDATIRAGSVSLTSRDAPSKGTVRGWKEYFWGGSKRDSAASSVSGDAPPKAARPSSGLESRRPPLQEDLFNPPADAESVASSGASSAAPQSGDRKASTSLASLALRLVAGGSVAARDGSGSDRGRSSSAGAGTDDPDTSRTPSMASARTTQSTRAISTQGGPRALMTMRRNPNVATAAAVVRTHQQDRREGATASPPSGKATNSQQESYGPVEMDTIMPPEDQPPTLTQTYNNYGAPEYLTDRFGFIYDQRRKKRQREATQMSRYLNNRAETLANGRTDAPTGEQPLSPTSSRSDSRPDSPTSLEERDEGKQKRWQDYLKIATFPTELLAHMPTISVPSLEVMEGAEAAARAPALTPGDRGFVPTVKSTSAVDNDASHTPEPDPNAATLVKEDTEPVKLLLQQLNDVHDSLQREKTVRWNDFLRKVRAERRREGEAEVAAAAAAASARFERPAVILPEAKLTDGEMIGISGLGNKGKVGRAKWNEFKALLLGGIPVAYRNKIWSECSGASALRVPGYYEDLVARSAGADDPAVVAQIDMDIHRTLTDNIFFRKGPGVARLREVLLAYARRNAEVGYCQGMNLVTANLLLIMPSAEDAFWVLASVVENILPRGYYDHSLLASRADQLVLRRYVADVLPKLSAHLDALGVELEALTFQWFLSVFTDCLSAEALFRVWDVVLCVSGGSAFLFQVALALLKLNEGPLLGCATAAQVYTYINHQMTNHAISIDGLVQGSEALRRVVRREEVEERRGVAIRGEKEVMREREAARARGRGGTGGSGGSG